MTSFRNSTKHQVLNALFAVPMIFSCAYAMADEAAAASAAGAVRFLRRHGDGGHSGRLSFSARAGTPTHHL